MQHTAKPITETRRILRFAMWCALAAIISFIAQFLVPSAVTVLFAAFLLLFGASIVALVLVLLSFVRARFLKQETTIAVPNIAEEQKSQARKLFVFLAVGCYIFAVMQLVSPHPPTPGRWSWLTLAVYESLGNVGLVFLWLGSGTFFLVAVGRR